MKKTAVFSDFFKNGFSNLDVFSKISAYNVMVCLLFTLAVAVFIFFIYKVSFRGVVYSYTFNLSLIIMCLLTALIILTISSNVVLSLGMVGALSVVRFRTAVKDPMDIAFMFWSMTAGIASGAGIYSVSILGSLFTGLVVLIASKYEIKEKKYMFIIHYSEDATDEVKLMLDKVKCVMKSKTITRDGIEMAVEVKVNNNNTAFVNKVSEIKGVKDAALVSYNGDYAD